MLYSKFDGFVQAIKEVGMSTTEVHDSNALRLALFVTIHGKPMIVEEFVVLGEPGCNDTIDIRVFPARDGWWPQEPDEHLEDGY